MRRVRPPYGRQTRVLLAIPNQRWAQNMEWSIHPYALCQLASMIENNYEVKILDANVDNLSPPEVLGEIIKFSPDILGVSVLANAYKKAAFTLFEMAKSFNSDIVTIIGGVFTTTRPDAAFECSSIDYGVMGEGEFVLPQLLDFITCKIELLPQEGIIYREANKLVIKPQKTFIQDLDTLPFPNYNYVDYSKYSTTFRKSVEAPRALPYGKIITSRGCPIGCIFCQVENISGKNTRYKSAEKVVEEIQILINQFGIKAIEFEDDNFLGSIKRTKRLFELMILKNWDLVWNAMNVSVFFLNEEILDLMKASKCQYLSMAIESGSPRVLKEIINKPVNLEHAKKMAAYAKKIGIDTTSLFVIGFPGETWDEIRQTIRFAEELGTDYVKFNVATAFPGTKLHDLAIKAQSLDPTFDFDNIQWGEAGISTSEFSAKQLTILRALEWDRVNFSSEEKFLKIASMMNISQDELKQVRRRTISI